MRYLLIATLLLAPCAGIADMIVAARTIRAQSIITAQDLVIKNGGGAGVAVSAADLIGQEARVSLYAGRAIRLADVGPPALVERNQIVPLIFEQYGLSITAEGRSLSRAGPGEYVRVMNMSSRATVSGRVMPDGRVRVSQ